jgi:hypothetical protein
MCEVSIRQSGFWTSTAAAHNVTVTYVSIDAALNPPLVFGHI